MLRKMLFLTVTVFLTVAFSAPVTYSYKGVWNATAIYNGDYTKLTGDTVEYGDFNGKKLYWWCQWWSQAETPGEFGAEGGTSPWVLLNSNTFDPTTKIVYQPKYWNNQIATSIQANQAVIPTWRDGAEGAYTIIHDDIGALDYVKHVKPGLDVNRLHPKVKVSWGVFVGEADETEWGQMKTMVQEGHEMTCHSMHHTSAADQWYFILPDSTVPKTALDPGIPRSIGGLKVIAFPFPQAYIPANANKVTTVENSLITVSFTADWMGAGVSDAQPITITPKAGVQEITLETGQKVYVKYTKMDTIAGANEGEIAVSGFTWFDYDATLMGTDANFIANGGYNWFVAKIFAIKKWTPPEYKINLTDAKKIIDDKVYTPLAGKFGPYFPPNMKTSYFCYPFDAYSETTHDSLNENGYISGRGGAKSGKAMPGDFFHPFRLDFDAFYMVDANHATLFPANPHSKLPLDGMLDSIIKSKGYMIRELHAVCDLGYPAVNDGTAGGWWGGITKVLYNSHLTKVETFIDENKLTTFNASEVIRYRLTANAAKSAALTADGSNYVLKVTSDPIDDKYKDEISVIVKLASGCDKMDVKYKTSDATYGDHPRRPARKLNSDGSAWSVNVNPYLGDAVIYPNTDWTGPQPQTPIAFTPAQSSVKSKVFQGYQSGRLIMSLDAGAYTANVYTADGKIKMSYNGIADMYKVALNATGLAQGNYIIKVIQGGKNVVTEKFVVVGK